ncbi:MAG: acetate--CoA ligase family protein [Anaerolineales bacterium]|nr:acetate--CoA ligase family protein [Anaerolineales bacterium]
MDKKIIDALLTPKSVAVVGASNTPGKIGNTVVAKLIEGGYKGQIYPINPKDGEVLGLKAYASVSEVPDKIDNVVIAIPADYVPPVIEECGKKGVKAITIISSGFSEVGKTELEENIVKKAHEYGMGVLGPNIIGVLSNSENLNASFAPSLPLDGPASLVSQSGALLISLDMATYIRKVGFEKLISIGNMSDINFADLIEWLDQDDKTQCISLYIEGVKDGRRFINNCIKAKKPIVALKSGKSEHGAAAAASHTGSLAGAAKIYDSAFKQATVIQASSVSNLFDRTLALSLQPPMKGDNLLIITNGGGVGVLATDSAEEFNIPLKFAPADLQEEMKKHMPAFGSAKNPVDITGGAGLDWYYDSSKFAYTHKWVDALVILYCETAVTDPMEIAQGIFKAVTEGGMGLKPVTVSFVGGERSENALSWLVEHGIPAYNSPDIAINAIAALREHARGLEVEVDSFSPYKDVDKEKALDIIAKARKDGRKNLTEIESKGIFSAYNMSVAKTKLSTTEDEAVKLAEEIGYPVVLKLVSPDILHKSDAGGVKVNIKSEAEVREWFNKILSNAKAYKADANIFGVAIQEMAPWGTETIIGSVNDHTFGPTVMFGLGGIFVEVLKDVTFRVAPVNEEDSMAMLKEIQSYPILDGARGEPRQDQEALAKTLSRYSQMIFDLKDEIAETDANPVLVYDAGEGCKVVDARVILK